MHSRALGAAGVVRNAGAPDIGDSDDEIEQPLIALDDMENLFGVDDLLADPQEQDDFVGSQSGKSREELRASCKLYKLSTRGSNADLAARVEEKLREEAALIGDSSSEEDGDDCTC